MAFTPDFGSQLSIESIITAPLVAVSKANVVMTTGQTRALLENCFTKTADGGYEPVMIHMSLTRGFLDQNQEKAEGPGNAGPDSADVKLLTLTFAVPLLCLIPINNLVVEKLSIAFDMEITSVTHRVTDKGFPDTPGGKPIIKKQAILHGRITNNSGKSSADTDGSPRLNMNIDAGPLPLPVGLLSVLELYSRSIQPVPSAKQSK